jgi:protein TonB
MSYQALLFCPDERTARLVTQVLSELDFNVEPSNEPFTAVKRLMAQHFDAVVVDCDNEQNATLLFKSARNSASNQSSLAVAVVEGQAGVAKAFRIGANLVLTKPINVDQAKGTLRVARGLLRKSDANKSAATTAPATPAFTPAAQPKASPSVQKTVPIQAPKFTPPASPAPQTRFAPVAQASAPEQEVHESAVLDLPPDLAPAAESTVVRPANKQYAWQKPASKPTGPMASALQRAAEAEDNPLDVSDANESLDPTDAVASHSIGHTAPQAPSFSVSASAAASAPAPAKQRVEPKAVAPAVKPIPQTTPAAEKPASAVSKLTISAPAAEEEPASAPAEGYPEAAPKKSGSNTGLIAAVVVLVLAGAGYFGWTKLHTHTAAPAAQTYTLQSAPKPAVTQNAAPATATPGVEQPKTTVEQKPSAGITAPQTTHTDETQTSVKSPSEPEKNSKTSASNKTEKEEPEVSETPAPQPMIVKSGAPKQKSPEAAPVDAPDPLMASTGSGDKNLAGIASTGLQVAKPVQQSLRVSQGVLQGRLIKKVQPVYPSTSQRLRIQGIVQLAATISKNGDVTNVKVLSGDPNLGRAAVDAVKQWKYKPYMLDGHPLEVQTQISVEFKLPG